VLVIDAPMAQGLDKLRRFAVPPALRFPQSSLSAAAQMALVLQAPTLLQRRGLDLLWLQQQVQAALHESWPTARLADLVHLSVAQFHARFVELTDRTRRTGCAACVWMPPCCSSKGARTRSDRLRCGYASASALAYALRRERGVTSRQLREPR
jgi:AraC-like DNA-binding protein